LLALLTGARAAYAKALAAWQSRGHSLALRDEQLQRLCQTLREYANDGPLAQMQVAALARRNVACRNPELARAAAKHHKDNLRQPQTTRQTRSRSR
jgi:arginine/lysine/ornithine decarboxylase